MEIYVYTFHMCDAIYSYLIRGMNLMRGMWLNSISHVIMLSVQPFVRLSYPSFQPQQGTFLLVILKNRLFLSKLLFDFPVEEREGKLMSFSAMFTKKRSPKENPIRTN